MRTTLARFCCWCIAGTAGTHVNLRAGFLRRPPPWGRTQGVGFYHFEASVLRPSGLHKAVALKDELFLRGSSEAKFSFGIYVQILRQHPELFTHPHMRMRVHVFVCACVCVREQFIEEGNEDTRRQVSQQGSGTDIGTRKNKQSVHRKRREHTQRKQRGSITAKWT